MTTFAFLAHVLVQAALMVRVLMRPNRDPASRLAWSVVILSLPVVGILAYLLVGETSIGERRARRMQGVIAELPPVGDAPGMDGEAARPGIPDRWLPLFRAGASMNGFEAVGGNSARLLGTSADAIDAMVADIEAARQHVHVLFYIWLPDHSGTRISQALMRAARRGVACRAMVDDLGSRSFIRSPLWAEMGEAGVKLTRALPIGNPLARLFGGRIDLRNHRKIVVIDNFITYCGSQNCADAAFLPKARYAPWVDIMVRFEGPIARQNQSVFAADWMTFNDDDDDLRSVLKEPISGFDKGFAAQVIATGPTVRYSAMPEMFQSLMFSAREELFITTPYYAPVPAIQAALCAASSRGVDTTLILPRRNDDFAVAATSRSYYHGLLKAGVKVHEYVPGLLHAKTLTVDGQVAMIGSANMDRRSFELNYENNILFHDPAVTGDLRRRQGEFQADSVAVTLEEVEAWKAPKRLFNNVMAMVSPLI